jgi:hypothetical protein
VLSRVKAACTAGSFEPVHLALLKFENAATFTVWRPSPLPAGNENVQLDLFLLEVW